MNLSRIRLAGSGQTQILPSGQLPAVAAWEPAVKGTVYGVVLNDQGDLERLGDSLLEAPYKGKPRAPALYIKPENTLVGHGATVTLPARATELAIGATLGLVIGRSASRVSAEAAMEYVRGYTVVIDLSIPHASVYRPAIREKCFDGACPMGASVVDRAGLGDPHAFIIRSYVNDVLVAEWRLDRLVRNIPRLIAEVSEFMTLLPDQVLLPAVPLAVPTARAGDRVAVDIEGVGRVEVTLVGGGEA